MLTHLVIRNFAIIDHLEIPIDPGFTVLTGETGAGKSIIVDALNLVLGGRATTSVIRSDGDEAVVEASFYLDDEHYRELIPLLDDLGIEALSNQLIVRRLISRSGRHKVIVNDSIVTVSTLQRLTHHLVDISGQHEHYSLMNESEHLGIVDNFGTYSDILADYRAAFDHVRTLRTKLKKLNEQVDNRLQRIDFIRFQLKELQEAKLVENEEEQLEAECVILKNAEKVSTLMSGALGALSSDSESGAVSAMVDAIVHLEQVSRYLPEVGEYIQRLKEMRVLVEDIAHDLAVQYRVDQDPMRLDLVQSRLEQLKRLRRKHGRTILELIRYAQELGAELDQIENNDAWLEACEIELKRAEESAIREGLRLSSARTSAAATLSEHVMVNLARLNMGQSQFVIENRPLLSQISHEIAFDEYVDELREWLSPTGIDDIHFLIAPNLGEPPKPIAKIASGGELSRIMLAIKRVLADRDNFSTYVFDEVDSGISGETADHVANMIRETANDRQVLCITHLPQIASRADHHLLVKKSIENQRTTSSIMLLDHTGRVEEISRMLGGSRVTDKTRAAAQELVTQRRVERSEDSEH